jgi:hypothetical protein
MLRFNRKSKGIAVILFLILFVVLIVAILFVIIYASSVIGSLTSDVGTNKPMIGGSTSGSSLECPSNLDPVKAGVCLDKYMKSRVPNSPLIGYGQTFVSAGSGNNVSPALMVAIAQEESSLGTTGIAVNEGGHNYYGLTATSGGNRKFASWEEAINYQAQYLRKNYLDEGLSTIETIGAKYCPVGASNDPNKTNSGWVPGVTKIYDQIIAYCPELVATGAGSGDIVAVAKSQLGVKEAYGDCNCGEPLKYGGSSGLPWCAYFASWVYKTAGYNIPSIGGAQALYDWFGSNQTKVIKGSGDPLPGDVVYFAHSHVGIVESYSGGTLNTIEGNSSNMVRKRTYTNIMSNSDIVGFGRWKK